MRITLAPRIRMSRGTALKAAAVTTVALAAGLTLVPSASAADTGAVAAAPASVKAASLPSAGTPQGNRALADKMIKSDAQFKCFSNIVERESTWNHKATNPSSGAYGLVQALPANKMASAGGDWKTNPATQIKWGLDYMKDRYGSPCGAWTFWQQNHWY
ncbi:transglycosylase SLT domain-containing protein [Streptomyces sp. NPDC051940]|uniref:aggregation-promoting factor C-terminal-like domain-containing protein n=1 Tax=Streptomyces sp. NPDC051940 TaxID=3155675 RepID=UPI0034132690